MNYTNCLPTNLSAVFVKKLPSAVIAFSLLLAPIIHAQQSATTTAAVKPEDQTVAIAFVGNLAEKSLNPQINGDLLVDSIVYENVYQGLTHITSSGSLEMLLAEQIAITKEGNKAIITLRDGIKWSDGSPLTSADVIANLDQVKSGDNPDGYKLHHISEYTATDDKTIEMTSTRPDPDFLYNLTTAGAVLVKMDSKGQPIGTGPYVISDPSTMPATNKVTLTANPHYWAGTSAITNATVQLLPTNEMAVTSMQFGGVDFIPNFHDPLPAQVFAKDKQVNLQVGFSEQKVILAMNNTEARLKKPLLRKAFAHSINKKTLADDVMLKTAPIIGSHFSISHIAHVDLSSSYPNSVDIATQLVELAEIDDKSFTLKIPNESYLTRTAESIKSDLAKVGIDITIVSLTPDEFATQVLTDKDYQLALVNHPETNDIGLYATDNYMNYKNPYFSVAYNLEIREMGSAARNATLNLLQRFLALDQPAVYLYQMPNINISKKSLYGYRLHAPINAIVISDLFWDR